MYALHTRIRKARLLAGISQAELARCVGVRRSAVTQWEHPEGTTPSMEHLIRLAMETAICVEWLATGRGPVRLEAGPAALPPVKPVSDAVPDPQEVELLMRYRRLPSNKRRIAMQILQVLGGAS